MSHLTTFKNNSLINTKKDLLIKAIEEIPGLSIDFDKKNVRNTWIDEPVDACFKKDGNYIAVGVRFEKTKDGDEQLTVAGDFYGTGLRQEELTNKIAQVYQKHNVIATCEEARWFVDEDKIREENGEIIIEAYRYA